MRTGWAAHAKNATRLALAAEQVGVQMLTIHGRTREQGYKGFAEHETVADIKSRVRIPVVANGDIASPEAAQRVLQATGADAVMVGRAAQGRPWIFSEIAHFLARTPRASAQRCGYAGVDGGAPARALRALRRIYRRSVCAQAPWLVCPTLAHG